MPPRPAPDLAARRERICRAAWRIAEEQGWTAVTMRRLAAEIGATQPVVYSAFPGRRALIEAVVLEGFAAIADALDAVPAEPLARMRAYLDFAAAHPSIYEAMFSLPSELPFGEAADGPLARAFAALRGPFSGAGEVRTELVWATVHGLATLQASGRLPAATSTQRLEEAHRVLTT